MTFNYNDIDETPKATTNSLDVMKNILGIELFNAWCNNKQEDYFLNITTHGREEVVFEANRMENYCYFICHVATNPTRMQKLREGYRVSDVVFYWERCRSSNTKDEYHSQMWREMQAVHCKKNNKY